MAAILLTDARSWRSGVLNYQTDTSVVSSLEGRITGVRMTIPAGTQLPARIRAYVIVDGFPLSQTVL